MSSCHIICRELTLKQNTLPTTKKVHQKFNKKGKYPHRTTRSYNVNLRYQRTNIFTHLID